MKTKRPPAALLRSIVQLQEAMTSTLYDAQGRAFDALEADTQARRTELALEALLTNPLTADGWCLLAERMPAGSPLALAMRRQAVAAGMLALGPIAFVEDVGEFWGLIETRPYMRALAALAEELWLQGERDAAIAQAREQLRLNPGDNQGARYTLMGWLIESGRDDEARALLETYPGDSFALWPWADALLRFRADPNGPAATLALREAIAANQHVAKALTGRLPPKQELPFGYTFGSPEEALFVMRGIGTSWARTPGAAEWLAAEFPAATPPPRKPRRKPHA